MTTKPAMTKRAAAALAERFAPHDMIRIGDSGSVVSAQTASLAGILTRDGSSGLYRRGDSKQAMGVKLVRVGVHQ